MPLMTSADIDGLGRVLSILRAVHRWALSPTVFSELTDVAETCQEIGRSFKQHQPSTLYMVGFNKNEQAWPVQRKELAGTKEALLLYLRLIARLEEYMDKHYIKREYDTEENPNE